MLGLGAFCRRSLASAWRNRTALVGSGILVLAVAAAVAAPALTSYDPSEVDLRSRLSPPSLSGENPHLLGTDELGRDILTRMLYGIRISMFIGVVTVVISGGLGVTLGLLSGYHRGLLDAVLTTVFDVQQSLPPIVLAIMIIGILGAGLWNTVLVLGISGWILFARLVRGEVLAVREREYILAERAIGASDPRIMVLHVLPNVASPTIVMASFTFAMFIIAEASLSFLGLGVRPPMPSLGGMLSTARQYLQVAPWYSISPGLPVFLIVLGANVLGDWLRDWLDPTLRNL